MTLIIFWNHYTLTALESIDFDSVEMNLGERSSLLPVNWSDPIESCSDSVREHFEIQLPVTYLSHHNIFQRYCLHHKLEN